MAMTIGTAASASRENALQECRQSRRRLEGARVLELDATDPTGTGLAARIEWNRKTGEEARDLGSSGRSRASAFLTSSVLLTHEILQASVIGTEPSRAVASDLLRAQGLTLPTRQVLASDVARLVMGRGVDRNRVLRAAYAANELLLSGGDDPASYLQLNGGVKGLKELWEARLRAKDANNPRAKPTPRKTPTCYALVRVSRAASNEDRRLVEQLSHPDSLPYPQETRILRLDPALLTLIINAAVVLIAHADCVSDLTLPPNHQEAAPPERVPAGRQTARADQDGLPF